MTFSIGVVAHIARQQMAEQLANQVQADCISVDDGTLGCEQNHLHVQQHLHAHHPDTDWHLILEDDAIPCNNFREQLHQALTVAPTPIVSLYLGTNRPHYYQPIGTRSATPLQPLIADATQRADHTNTPWITSRSLFHAVAYTIRTDLVDDLLNNIEPSRPIDKAISRWAETRHHPVAYTWPSLTNHRDEPTLFHHPDGAPRTEPRKAWRHGTRATWTNQTVQL